MPNKVSIPHGQPRPFSPTGLGLGSFVNGRSQFLTDSPGHLAPP